MKTYKWFDFYMQLLMIPAGFVFGFLANRPEMFFYPYFTVGAWQVISCIIHASIKGYYPVRGRNSYEKTIIAMLGIGFILIVPLWIGADGLAGFVIAYLAVMLIVSPFLAIWYAVICYREIMLLENKELSELK
jgi:hypothetical protein